MMELVQTELAKREVKSEVAGQNDCRFEGNVCAGSICRGQCKVKNKTRIAGSTSM